MLARKSRWHCSTTQRIRVIVVALLVGGAITVAVVSQTGLLQSSSAVSSNDSANRGPSIENPSSGRMDDCPSGQFGPNCIPCRCSSRGVCDDGRDGTGKCTCSFPFGGETCEGCVSERTGPDCRVNAPIPPGRLQGFNWCGPHQVVALTFDDGVLGDRTLAVLAALKQVNITATFFLSPQRGMDFANTRRALVEMAQDGHEIQSHGFSHTNLLNLTNDQIEEEIQTGRTFVEEILVEAGLQDRMRFDMFRPPFGAFTREHVAFVNSLGYKVAMWNVNPRDYEEVTLQEMQDEISSSISVNRSHVVLLHDARLQQGFLEWALEFYVSQGYRFVTMSECYAMCANDICNDPMRYTTVI